MDNIESLIEEHATLRRLASEIGKAIGAQHGVGWDDRTSYEPQSLCMAQQRFHDELKKHEAREESVIDEMLRDREAERVELEPEIRRAHDSLDGMAALLRTLSTVCDGTHVYAVRTVAERLNEELQAHLAHEEQVLFPLLRRRRTTV
jgi:iron-sulfur cluster repair protein YtfE (RIC family)